MIRPSVGRVVWFHPHLDEGHTPADQPHAALVVHVLDDRTVNLAVFNQSGAPYSRQAVQLLQDDDLAPASGHFAMWMPFQVGQAKKTEAAESGAGAAQLQPVHDKIAELEKAVQGKFEELGDWLTKTFADIHERLEKLASPTASDPAPAAAPASGAAPQTAEPGA
jgi:hypothetical protein